MKNDGTVDTTITGDVSGIKAVIPANASSSNKLVTASDIPGYEGEYVSVTPVTGETFNNLLSRLYALIDFSKLTINSYLVIETTSTLNILKRPSISLSTAAVTFSAVVSDAGDPGIDIIYMSSSSVLRKRGTILPTPAVRYTDMGAQTVQSWLVSVKIYY